MEVRDKNAASRRRSRRYEEINASQLGAGDDPAAERPSVWWIAVATIMSTDKRNRLFASKLALQILAAHDQTIPSRTNYYFIDAHVPWLLCDEANRARNI